MLDRRGHAASPCPCAAGDGRADSLRLARHSLARCGAVCELLGRLATIPEAFELARCCAAPSRVRLCTPCLVLGWG